jgi:hypothetical protein
MRISTRYAAASLLLASFAVPTSLTAQKRAPNIDGAWRWVRTDVASPDSTYRLAGWPGISIVSHGYFSQMHVNPNGAVQQASRPTTAEQKAARYDALLARAGTLELRDTLLVGHILHSTDPIAVGTTVTAGWRLRGDTLWQTSVEPWGKDSTKTVRSTYVFVRQR